jgi:hypothetical protein
MAQNWMPKQANWIQRFSDAVVGLLAYSDELTALCAEYSTETYGTGGANAITDAVAQSVLPASTALTIAQAEGAVIGSGAVVATVAANRGYLEAVRP